MGILSADNPDKLLAARNESPLILGIGKGENFIASDVPSILEYTNKIVYLEDKEIAVLTKTNFNVFDLNGKEKKKKIHTINWTAEAAQKQGYKHFMLKEIHEQPSAIADTLNDRILDNNIIFEKEFGFSNEQLKKINNIVILACGTSHGMPA